MSATTNEKVPDRKNEPTARSRFWDSQKAKSPIARYPWIAVLLLLLALAWEGLISPALAIGLAIVTLLIVIVLKLKR